MSSVSTTVKLRCPGCGQESEQLVYRHIDAVAEPELKARVLSGELFVHTCPSCGRKSLITFPVIYRDEHLLACLSDRSIAVEGLEGVSGRLVADIGSLIEKVKIFNAGLDDVPLEFCKFVTRQELGKDVDLKFLRLDGADNDIVFTYPEGGQMQMLAVGFNNYEDCRAIVARNPEITNGLSGLVRVDREWAEQFLR